MEDILYNPDLMAGAGALLVSLLAALMGLLGRWIWKKTQSQIVHDLYGKLQGALEMAVREVYQTYVASLKEAHADGKLTGPEKRAARDLAIAKVKSYLSLKELIRLFGSADDAEAALPGMVEATVNAVKKSSKGGEVHSVPS